MTWKWRAYSIPDTPTERALKAVVSEFASNKACLSLLDYGCGTGVRTERILEYLKPRKVEISLFDTDQDLLDSAIARLADGGGKPINGISVRDNSTSSFVSVC